MHSLTEKIVFSQLESTEDFPIAFDDAWKWLGFSRKDSAKRSLLSCDFIENEDLHIEVEPTTTGIQANPLMTIALSIDCFKQWAMMSATPKGKEVRRWYLQIEKEWRAMKSQAPAPKPSLPSSYDRATCVNSLVSALTTVGYDFTNPRYSQSIKDLVGDVLGLTQPALPESTEIWIGVAEKAERMGYAVPIVLKHRIQLGKHVAKFGLEKKSELRLCNGTQRPINLYLDCEELEDAIDHYMETKLANHPIM